MLNVRERTRTRFASTFRVGLSFASHFPRHSAQLVASGDSPTMARVDQYLWRLDIGFGAPLVFVLASGMCRSFARQYAATRAVLRSWKVPRELGGAELAAAQITEI